MIQVDSLSKEFAGRRALSDVSFSVAKSEILGFLGPNGAGKTTTMRILTGYIPPTSGSAKVAGYDVETESLEARRHIGYLPESVPLYREMTVRDYLDFVARLRDVPADQRASKIDIAMEKGSVTDVADRLIGKLSKGYRQRVGIAQAVLHDPDVLILDEPTEGLDPRQRQETRKLIRDLGREHCVILSTHILPEVETTADRVLIINEGHIVAFETAAGLSGRFRRATQLEVVIGGEESIARQVLQSIQGITKIDTESMPENRRRLHIEGQPDIEIRNAVARALVSANIDLYELRSQAISLEDIFIRLTTTDAAAVPEAVPPAEPALPVTDA